MPNDPRPRTLGRIRAYVANNLARRVDDPENIARAVPAEPGGFETRPYPTLPSRSRRSTLPGSAPVWAAFSTTIVPLTITVVRSPVGY